MSQDSSSQELLAQLNQGIQELQVDISTTQIELLLDYIIEFQRWNRTHNLSAIHDLKESVVLHLLDSLAVLPFLDRYVAALPEASGVFSLADLGTGGGLPGIPLAICRPTWQIHLMEAVQKKTVFLQHIAAKFNLFNIQVHAARIENSSPKLEKTISACISRAFSDFGKFVELSQPMLKDGGVLWAMKAKLLEEDLKTIPINWGITNNYQLAVPGLNAERRLFELAPVRELQS